MRLAFFVTVILVSVPSLSKSRSWPHSTENKNSEIELFSTTSTSNLATGSFDYLRENTVPSTFVPSEIDEKKTTYENLQHATTEHSTAEHTDKISLDNGVFTTLSLNNEPSQQSYSTLLPSGNYDTTQSTLLTEGWTVTETPENKSRLITTETYAERAISTTEYNVDTTLNIFSVNENAEIITPIVDIASSTVPVSIRDQESVKVENEAHADTTPTETYSEMITTQVFHPKIILEYFVQPRTDATTDDSLTTVTTNTIHYDSDETTAFDLSKRSHLVINDDITTEDTTVMSSTHGEEETTTDMMFLSIDKVDETLRGYRKNISAPEGGSSYLREECLLPKEEGICKASYQRFYFDAAKMQCMQFTYGGCQGNANNFESLHECQLYCDPADLAKSGDKYEEEYSFVITSGGAKMIYFHRNVRFHKGGYIHMGDLSFKSVIAISFSFRTTDTNCLLVYAHSETESLTTYLENGKLETKLQTNETDVASFTIMEAKTVHDGSWHFVEVKYDKSSLVLTCDLHSETFLLSDIGEETDDVTGYQIWLGGFSSPTIEEDSELTTLTGCMINISLTNWGQLHSSLKFSDWSNIAVGGICYTSCLEAPSCVQPDTSDQECQKEDKSLLKLEKCREFGKEGHSLLDAHNQLFFLDSIISLHGSEQVDFHLSDNNHIWAQVQHLELSFHFKTSVTDSVLLHAPDHKFGVTVSTEGELLMEMNTGTGLSKIHVKENVATDEWVWFLLTQKANLVQLFLNGVLKYEEEVSHGPRIHVLPSDSVLHIGHALGNTKCASVPKQLPSNGNFSALPKGGRYFYDHGTRECWEGISENSSLVENGFPNDYACLSICRHLGLFSSKSFVGCLRNIEFGSRDITADIIAVNSDLQKASSQECEYNSDKPLSFTSPSAQAVPSQPMGRFLDLQFRFQPMGRSGVLASGVCMHSGEYINWQILLTNEGLEVTDSKGILSKLGIKLSISNQWNSVSLEQDGLKICLHLNGAHACQSTASPLQCHPDVVLGTPYGSATQSFVGCMKIIKISGILVDTRNLELKTNDVRYDNCQMISPCEVEPKCSTNSKCVLKQGIATCQCNKGYEGSFCQFSKYTHSCRELMELGVIASGSYKVDLDGPGDLSPATVACEFNENKMEAKTTVRHNMSPHFNIRNWEMFDKKYIIEYHDFTDEHLKGLVESADRCSQSVEFECKESRLRLSSITWFGSPYASYITNMGTDRKAVCPCRVNGTCEAANVRCNCDIGDYVTRKDAAVITNKRHLPLTSLVVLKEDKFMTKRSKMFITLGSLECSEKVHSQSTISFTTKRSLASIPLRELQSLSFSFKTLAENVVLVSLTSQNFVSFLVILESAYRLRMEFDIDQETTHVNVSTSYPLNNGNWQWLWIQYNMGEFRLIVNSEPRKFVMVPIWKHKLSQMILSFGSISRSNTMTQFDGFVGCLQQVRVNHEAVELMQFVQEPYRNEVLRTCSSFCSSNPCPIGSKCVELRNRYECRCEQEDEKCDLDSLEGVTYLSEESYQYYFADHTNCTEYSNPIEHSFQLKFRTSQSPAILLFAVDNFQNFVQVQISSPSSIMAFFNNGTKIEMLHVDFGSLKIDSGEIVFVELNYSEDEVNLTVLVKGSTFISTYEGLRKLSNAENYKHDAYQEDEFIQHIAMFPKPLTVSNIYFYVYLGGLGKSTILLPDELKGFVGCLQEMIINNKSIALNDYKLWTFEDKLNSTVYRCLSPCETSLCKNGGLCLPNFTEATYSCDCDETSYIGSLCSEETSFVFDGIDTIFLRRNESLVNYFSLQMAFASTERSDENQVMFFAVSNSAEKAEYLLAVIDIEGYLVITSSIRRDNPETFRSTNLKVNDGQRHFFHVEITTTDTILKVDGSVHHFRTEETSEIIQAILQGQESFSLFIGGIPDNFQSVDSSHVNYSGCISNARVKFSKDERFDDIFENLRSDNASAYRLFGSPGTIATCGKLAAFIAAKSHGFDASLMRGSDWNPSFVWSEPYVPLVADAPPEAGSSAVTVASVFGAFFILLLICIAIYILKISKRKRDLHKPPGPRGIDGQDEEKNFVDGLHREECVPLLNIDEKYKELAVTPSSNQHFSSPPKSDSSPSGNSALEDGGRPSVVNEVPSERDRLLDSKTVPDSFDPVDRDQPTPELSAKSLLMSPPDLDNNLNYIDSEGSSLDIQKNEAKRPLQGVDSVRSKIYSLGPVQKPTLVDVSDLRTLSARETPQSTKESAVYTPIKKTPAEIVGYRDAYERTLPLSAISEKQDDDPSDANYRNAIKTSGVLDYILPDTEKQQESTRNPSSAAGSRNIFPRGRIVAKKPPRPVFLSADKRTFNNPISYFGGPNIVYSESEYAQSRRESVVSID